MLFAGLSSGSKFALAGDQDWAIFTCPCKMGNAFHKEPREVWPPAANGKPSTESSTSPGAPRNRRRARLLLVGWLRGRLLQHVPGRQTATHPPFASRVPHPQTGPELNPSALPPLGQRATASPGGAGDH